VKDATDKDLTAKETAAELKMGERYLRTRLVEGMIPGAYRHGGGPLGHWRIPRAALDAFLAARKNAA
jgi:hypothetical protein